MGRSHQCNAATFLFGTLGVLPFAGTVATLLFVAFNALTTRRQTAAVIKNSETAAQQVEVARKGLENTQTQIDIARDSLANTTAMLEQNRAAEVVARFQRAAELLENSNDAVATNVAGVMLLGEIAREQPDRYYNIVLNLLIVFAEQRTADAWEAVAKLKNITSGEQEHENADLWDRAFAQTSEEVLAAVRVIGEIRNIEGATAIEQKWLGGQALRLRRVTLVDQTIVGGNFSGMKIEDGFLVNMKFANCKFQSTTLFSATIIETIFNSCDLSNAYIKTSGKIDAPVIGQKHPRRLSFTNNCDLRGAEIRTGREQVIARVFKRYDEDHDLFGSADDTEREEAREARHAISQPIESGPKPARRDVNPVFSFEEG